MWEEIEGKFVIVGLLLLVLETLFHQSLLFPHSNLISACLKTSRSCLHSPNYGISYLSSPTRGYGSYQEYWALQEEPLGKIFM